MSVIICLYETLHEKVRFDVPLSLVISAFSFDAKGNILDALFFAFKNGTSHANSLQDNIEILFCISAET